MEAIQSRVLKLKTKYKGFSPEEVCQALGITVLYKPMGNFKGACKGFFINLNRMSYITVNSDLPENYQRIIISHELGHAVLHRKEQSVRAFHDISLFDDGSKLEYEANIFAAEFLLDDKEIFSVLNEDLTFFAAASVLNVPVELLDFKWRAMKKRGYKIVDTPVMAKGNFLKDI